MELLSHLDDRLVYSGITNSYPWLGPSIYIAGTIIISAILFLLGFLMPKFSVACKLNLIDIMENLGITNVFSSDSADFSPISKSEKLALSKAEQTTRIKMTENGVEAASFVEMSVMELGIPPKYRRVKFILNRPFLFYIVASNAMPIFAGKLLDPRENEETMSEE